MASAQSQFAVRLDHHRVSTKTSAGSVALARPCEAMATTLRFRKSGLLHPDQV